MKKVFLLLIAGSFAMATYAQQLQNKSVVFGNSGINNARFEAATAHPARNAKFTATGEKSGQRTTTGGGRWYSYADYLANLVGTGNWAETYLNIWNDTTAVCGYTSAGTPTYYINTWTSVGMGLNPMFSGFNDVANYSGLINVTPSDAYTIDSVSILGLYTRGTDHTSTDHLKLGLVYGDLSSTSNLPDYFFTGMTTSYGTDTVSYAQLLHDSLNNTAANASGAPSATIVMESLTEADTTSMGMSYTYPVGPIAVPMANIAAMAISFVSGSSTYTPFDTLVRADNSVKYGNFCPIIMFDGTSSAAAFPPYDRYCWNAGYFKREGSGDAGWGGYYIPNWAWTSAGGASDLQYPVVSFHVTCATCWLVGVENVNKTTINNVVVSPNPANDVVAVGFDLANSTDVTVTLSNLYGQVIATQVVKATSKGNVEFTTSNLASGVYVYNVQTASGNTASGRISVAH